MVSRNTSVWQWPTELRLRWLLAQVRGSSREALLAAVQIGREDMVQAVLDSQQQAPAELAASALRRAAACGQARIILLLRTRYAARADADDSLALRIAARMGHLRAVRMLRRGGEHAARADAVNSEALRDAALAGHAAVVKELRAGEHAARADVLNHCALRVALHSVATLRELRCTRLPHAARADAVDSVALRDAAAAGATEAVRELLQGEHPARADARHDEALRSAVARRHLPICGLLVCAPHPPSADAVAAYLQEALRDDDAELVHALRGGVIDLTQSE